MRAKKTDSQYTLSSRKKKNFTTAMGFLIVPLLFYTFFVIAPVFQAAYYSLFNWNGLGPITNFIGFKNFVTIFKDSVFLTALKNNFLIIVLSLLLQLPTALILALAIGRRFKGSTFFRSIFFLPFILSEIIAGTVWTFMYNPQFGLQNTTLVNLIPALKNFSFLGDPKHVFYSIFIVIWWKYFGLHMVIMIAGLQNIPDEVVEAAYVDGVNNFQLNWHIILPLLKPTILISVFFSIIGSLQTFAIIWAMGRGDPVHAAETMVTYLYKFGFLRFSLGYGSSVAIVIFLICLVFNILYQRSITGQEQQSG